MDIHTNVKERTERRKQITQQSDWPNYYRRWYEHMGTFPTIYSEHLMRILKGTYSK